MKKHGENRKMGYFNTNPYAAYQNTGIKTASQGKLVVLLYEGAIKNLTSALECFKADGTIQAKNIEKFGSFIMKTQDIISELEVSLDMEKGGQISTNLMSLYVYFNQELMAANISKDKKKIEFVLKMLNELSSAWNQAANSQANSPANSRISNGINIEG
ncbi:flagellar export chaperone FliS [Treponema pectinovorum]|uniref:flagellar export chaperone FliS n=1 Tax=Treponema pectinovorum TaxID=164 RepID=UPI002091311E|nr:flagellar export chaperone FliS [Treponema pectinovorum]